MTAGASVSFDRIAAEYDRTRSLPARTMQKVLALLAKELRGRRRCLEIGVGTGRLALPLHHMGIPMEGVDLSQAMLARLREKAEGTWPFPVTRADATALPFRDGEMGAAMAAHVLHLIPGWRDALNELVRVVRPGGVILVDVGNWEGRGTWAVVRERFCKEAGIDRPFPGTQDPAAVTGHLQALGASPRELPPVYETDTVTVEELVEALAQGTFSFTWQLEEDARWAAADRTRRWAKERFGSLREPRTERRRIVWRAYDL